MAADQEPEPGDDGEPDGSADHGLERMAMDDVELGRVPDVGEQQDRSEHERTEHRERPGPRLPKEQRGGDDDRDADHAELRKRSGHRSERGHARRL